MDEKYTKLLNDAYSLHTSGKYEEAKFIYEKLLELYPNDLNIQNYYAQLNLALKNYDLALSLFKNIYDKTNISDILIDIAQVHMLKSNYDEAISSLLNLNDDNTEALYKLSLCYMKKQDYISAKDVYEKLFEKKPNDYFNLFNLSLCCKYLSDYENSLKYALLAFKLDETDADLLSIIAFLYEKLNKLEDSIIYLEKLLAIKPTEVTLYTLGIHNKKLGNFYKAVEYFDKVIQINPNNKQAMISLALTYKNIDMQNALEIFQDIQTIFPDDLMVKFFIFEIYYQMLDFENALKVGLEIIEANPNDASSYHFVGIIYTELNEYELAIKYLKKALEILPDDKNFILDLAEAYFCNGDLDLAEKLSEPFKDQASTYTFVQLKKHNLEKVYSGYYNWATKISSKKDGQNKVKRFFYKLNIDKKYNITEEVFKSNASNKADKFIDRLNKYFMKLPKEHEEISGKNILIHAQHGVGDVIMFSRYISFLKEKPNNIILHIPNSLERLIKFNFPSIKIYLNKEDIPEEDYDYTMPEMLTLCYSGTDLNSIPFSNGYLNVSDELINEMSKLDIFKTDKKKIGIFWQGNPTVLLNRSVKLKYFLPILNLEDVQIYSFQLSDIDFESAELKEGLPIIDMAEYIKDYADTGALLKNIDILITIDTSIANLAGAMGIKTYLLLPYSSEWRWFTDTETTPWYDSVRIFKQQKPKDWAEVIERVKNEL